MNKYYLLLESAILDKRWAICNAERELQQFGQWSSDWSIPMSEADQEIERLKAAMKRYETDAMTIG
jgi:hypothetical protein